MPRAAPDNLARTACGLPLKRPEPLHAALLHLSSILSAMTCDRAWQDMSTANIVRAIVQYVAESDSALLIPAEKTELLRLATWPTCGIPVCDVAFLLDDDNGRGERLEDVEAWLVRLCSAEGAAAAGCPTNDYHDDNDYRSDVDEYDQTIGIGKLNIAYGAAVKAGLVPILRWLVTQTGWHPSASQPSDYVSLAARHGHLEVLKWFVAIVQQHGDAVNFSAMNNYAARAAAKGGHLEVLKWLAPWPGVDFADFDNDAAFEAAKGGHLDVLKWLADQPGVGSVVTPPSSRLVLAAVGGGHIHVLKWLTASANVDFSTLGFNVAHLASCMGHVHVLEWLVSAEGGKFHIDFVGDGLNVELAYTAAQNGRLEVLKWLVARTNLNVPAASRSLGCFAARRGHLAVLEWLVAQPGVTFSGHDGRETNNHLVFAAVEGGRIEVLQWLAARGITHVVHNIPIRPASRTTAPATNNRPSGQGTFTSLSMRVER